MPAPTRDTYGGYPELKYKATGFFRLEKADRWWLVTPEGNAFLSFGINHVEVNRTRHPYNIAFWAERFGTGDLDDPTAFHAGFRAKARDDLRRLGINTLGCHTWTDWWDGSFMPYVKTVRFVNICHYMKPGVDAYHDVFSNDYVKHCDTVAKKEVAPRADDPFVLGYSMTDCPIFTELDAAPRINNVYGSARHGLPTWPNVLRNLPGDRPGKQAYIACMRDAYGNDIAAFNTVYQTAFESFDEIEKRAAWRPGVDLQNAREIEDNLRFLYQIVDKAYSVQVAAIRKYDTNHMIFGDKLNGNSNTPDEIVRLASKHMDLIFYQYYAFWQDQRTLLDRWSKLTDKPFLMGDSSVSIPTRNVPDPYGPHCGTQELRAERTLEIFTNAFARPDFVGWDWCGWMDQWHLNESPYTKQHSGLQTAFGEWHQPMVEVFSQFSAFMYENAVRSAGSRA